jgi:hypothetical protein
VLTQTTERFVQLLIGAYQAKLAGPLLDNDLFQRQEADRVDDRRRLPGALFDKQRHPPVAQSIFEGEVIDYAFPVDPAFTQFMDPCEVFAPQLLVVYLNIPQ